MSMNCNAGPEDEIYMPNTGRRREPDGFKRHCANCTVELHWTMNRGTGPVRRHERDYCSGRCADAGGRA